MITTVIWAWPRRDTTPGSGNTAFGSVSPATFRHLGVDYTVTSLHGGATQDLYFATTPNLPADGAGLTVHVQKYVGELDVPLAEGVFQSARHLVVFPGRAQYLRI